VIGAIGLVVAAVGLTLVVWGIAMLANYQQIATRYWEWVYGRNVPFPFWRSTKSSAARMLYLRFFGGTVIAAVGIVSMLAGFSFLHGWN
jgi:hypothetical protein